MIGEGVQIGEHCHIYPRVVIYPGTTLGNRVVVHAGAVLGRTASAMCAIPPPALTRSFPQQGTLRIEDDVEIGANSTIDRGALKETSIGRGTKIDNLVHVGHNCDIGEDVILVALHRHLRLELGRQGRGHRRTGGHRRPRARRPRRDSGRAGGVLSGKTVTNEGLKPGTVLWGTPARPLTQVLREIALLGRLAKKK